MAEDIDDLSDCFSVTFHDVKDCYSPHTPITCTFTLKENVFTLSTDSSCWIGIFLVAWDSLDSVISKVNFSTVGVKDSSGLFSVEFDISESTFKEDEFYQFCLFNTDTKDILGASCPFQVGTSVDANIIGRTADDNIVGRTVDDNIVGRTVQDDNTVRRGSIVHVEYENNTTLLSELNESVETAQRSGDFTSSVDAEQGWWVEGGGGDGDGGKSLVDEDFSVIPKLQYGFETFVKAENDNKEDIAKNQQQGSDLKEEKMITNTEAQVESLLREQICSLLANEESLQNELDACQNGMKEMENQTALLVQNLITDKQELAKLLCEKEEEHIERVRLLKEDYTAKLEKSEQLLSELEKKNISEINQRNEYEEEMQNLKIDACVIEIEKLSGLVIPLSAEVQSKDAQLSAQRHKMETLALQHEEINSKMSLENEMLRREITDLKSDEKKLLFALQEESLTSLRKRLSEMEISNDNVTSVATARRNSCDAFQTGSKRTSVLTTSIPHLQKSEEVCHEEDNNMDVCELQKLNKEYRLRLCMGKKAFDKQYLECQRLRNEQRKMKEAQKLKGEGRSCNECWVTKEEHESLRVKFNTLETDNHDLFMKIQRCEDEKIQIIEDKEIVYDLNDELKRKALEIVDNYEGKLSLLTEENNMLKAQLEDGILQGVPDTTLYPKLIEIDREVNEVITNSEPIVNQQPHGSQSLWGNNGSWVNNNGSWVNINGSWVNNNDSWGNNSKETVVERQPTLLSSAENSYSEEMIHNSKGGAGGRGGLQPEIVTPVLGRNPFNRVEPPSQMIPDRSSDEQVHVAGPFSTIAEGSPPTRCPVCALDFPSNFNDNSKNQHVNSHFDQD